MDFDLFFNLSHQSWVTAPSTQKVAPVIETFTEAHL